MKDEKSNSIVQVGCTCSSKYIVNRDAVDSVTETISKPEYHLGTQQAELSELDEFNSNSCACMQWIRCYLRKWVGKHEQRPPRVTYEDLALSFVGSIISMGIVALLHYRLLQQSGFIFLIGSFGATAVLLFAQPKAVVSQPRNMIGGQLICAIVGCIVRILLVDRECSVAAMLAVSISIGLMLYTETLHPPAGATALIAVIGEHPKEWAGFLFIFMPVLSAQLVMLCTALIINNIPSDRSYPTFWW